MHLKAALRSAPAPAEDAKARAMALAMENFDRLQGSTDAARSSQDRPQKAGFLNGVLAMLKSLTARPALAGTTSIAALIVGVAVILPVDARRRRPDDAQDDRGRSPRPAVENRRGRYPRRAEGRV